MKSIGFALMGMTFLSASGMAQERKDSIVDNGLSLSQDVKDRPEKHTDNEINSAKSGAIYYEVNARLRMEMARKCRNKDDALLKNLSFEEIINIQNFCYVYGVGYRDGVNDAFSHPRDTDLP